TARGGRRAALRAAAPGPAGRAGGRGRAGRRPGGGRVPGRAVRVRRGGRGARAARTHGAAHLHRGRRRPVGPAGPLRPLVTAAGARGRGTERRARAPPSRSRSAVFFTALSAPPLLGGTPYRSRSGLLLHRDVRRAARAGVVAARVGGRGTAAVALARIGVLAAAVVAARIGVLAGVAVAPALGSAGALLGVALLVLLGGAVALAAVPGGGHRGRVGARLGRHAAHRDAAGALL